MKQNDSFDLLARAGLRPKKKSPEALKYASFNRRMWAATIDTLLVGLFTPLIDWAVEQMYGPMTQDPLELAQQAAGASEAQLIELLHASGFIERWVVNFELQVLVFAIFSLIFWHFWAATPGKMLLGMKIVDAKTEAPITFYQGLLRLPGYVISGVFFGLGYFWVGIDKRKQGWHDKIADTVVILTRGSKAADRSGSQEPAGAE